MTEKSESVLQLRHYSAHISSFRSPNAPIPFCCDVAVAQINYPSFKHNTQNSIEEARGRSHGEDSSQIFMLDDMQFGGGLDVI